MKITALDTVVVNAEMRNWVFVKVTTDEGIVGWGEATVEWKTRAVVGCVEDYRTLLVARTPPDRAHLADDVPAALLPAGHGRVLRDERDRACLLGHHGQGARRAGLRLLGGAVRDTVRLYDHLGGGEMHSVYHALTPEQARERARESLELGFDAIKLEVVIPRTGRLDGAGALRHADAVMAAVREEVGDDVELMVDMHGRCSPMMAAQYFTVLEPYRPWFFEEPCPPEHPRAMAELARRTTCRSRPASGCARATRSRTCSRSAPARCSSPTPCTAAGSPSCAGSRRWARPTTRRSRRTPRPGRSATPRRCTSRFATPNFIIQETWRADVPWRFDVLSQTLPFEGGTAQLPTAPGLGVEVDEREAAKHPFQQEPLMRYFHDDGSVADW